MLWHFQETHPISVYNNASGFPANAIQHTRSNLRQNNSKRPTITRDHTHRLAELPVDPNKMIVDMKFDMVMESYCGRFKVEIVTWLVRDTAVAVARLPGRRRLPNDRRYHMTGSRFPKQEFSLYYISISNNCLSTYLCLLSTKYFFLGTLFWYTYKQLNG